MGFVTYILYVSMISHCLMSIWCKSVSLVLWVQHSMSLLKISLNVSQNVELISGLNDSLSCVL